MHTLLANCPILFPNAEAKQLRAYLIEDTPTTAFEGDDDESEFSCSVITKSTDFSLQADVLSFDHGLIVSKLLHMDLCTPQQQATAAANLAIDNIRGANRYGLHDQKSKYDDEPDVTQAVKTLRVRLSITTALRPEDLAILIESGIFRNRNQHPLCRIDRERRRSLLRLRPHFERRRVQGGRRRRDGFHFEPVGRRPDRRSRTAMA